jgi:hypothetical protein
MKKLLTLLAVFAVLSTALFAAPYGDDFAEREKYDAEKTTTKTIIPEDQHCTDKNGKVWKVEIMENLIQIIVKGEDGVEKDPRLFRFEECEVIGTIYDD